MLPPTEATASVSLGEKPVPHSCREKMLGTRVCFTRESKKGSRLSSGWWEGKAEAGQGCVSAVPSPGALCTQGRSPCPRGQTGTRKKATEAFWCSHPSLSARTHPGNLSIRQPQDPFPVGAVDKEFV